MPLLAEVYIELTGGRQRGLSLAIEGGQTMSAVVYEANLGRTARLIIPSAAELAAHALLVGRLNGAIWTG